MRLLRLSAQPTFNTMKSKTYRMTLALFVGIFAELVGVALASDSPAQGRPLQSESPPGFKWEGPHFNTSPQAGGIAEESVTPAELASALGVRPFCANLILDGASHPRLTAEIKDKDGKTTEHHVTPGGGPHKIYRIRVFLFQNAQSRVPERLIFNLSAYDNVAGNAFIDFPTGSGSVRTTTSSTRPWFYEAAAFGPEGLRDEFFRVRLRIETSPTPYPVPSSTLDNVSSETEAAGS
jgi:hypothetical protein